MSSNKKTFIVCVKITPIGPRIKEKQESPFSRFQDFSLIKSSPSCYEIENVFFRERELFIACVIFIFVHNKRFVQTKKMYECNIYINYLKIYKSRIFRTKLKISDIQFTVSLKATFLLFTDDRSTWSRNHLYL